MPDPATTKRSAISRLNQAEGELRSPAKAASIQTFLMKYILCEAVVKKVLLDYKREMNPDIKPTDLKMYVKEINKALRRIGVEIDGKLSNRLFGNSKVALSKESANQLRNRLMHSASPKVINEIHRRANSLNADMDSLLNAFR